MYCVIQILVCKSILLHAHQFNLTCSQSQLLVFELGSSYLSSKRFNGREDTQSMVLKHGI